MIRILSAFIFAISLLCICFMGFWYGSMHMAKGRVEEVLKNALNAELSYTSIEPRYELAQVNMVLHDVRVKIPYQNGKYIQYEAERVGVKSDFLGRYKIEFSLPTDQVLRAVSSASREVVYDATLESGKLFLYPNNREIALSYLHADISEEGQRIVRAGVGDIIVKLPSTTQTVLDVALKDVRGQLFVDGETARLPSLLIQGEFNGFPQLTDVFFPIFMRRTVSEWEKVFNDTSRRVADARGSVDFEDFIVRFVNGQSFSLKGRLSLDERIRLRGDLDVTSSSQKVFVDLLNAVRLVGVQAEQYNIGLDRVLERQKQSPFRYNVSVNQGNVLVNTVVIGVVFPFLQMLGLEPISPEPVLPDENRPVPAGV